MGGGSCGVVGGGGEEAGREESTEGVDILCHCGIEE